MKPPRALFVPFPFGMALGRANDPELQHRVLRAALDLLAEPAGPVLRDFPDDAEMAERPAEVPLPNFIRYCADDLKALYFEGHMAMRPAAGGEEIAR